jgi:hypothetical protein
LREFGLRLFGPFFCAFQNVFEKFGCHVQNCITIRDFCAYLFARLL